MLIDLMSLETGLPVAVIEGISKRAVHMYKVYEIPKRNGTGTRTIEHPAKQLKVLQRWIAVRLLSQLPVHSSVFSYREGIGIAGHANQHRLRRYLMRMDLRDFFPSITRKAIQHLLHDARLKPPLEPQDIELVAQIVCRGHRLTIGAPSSPVLSNAILHSFDEDVCEHCSGRQIKYTRYADDLYFSTDTPNVLQEVLPFIRERLRLVPGLILQVNEAKTTFTSAKRKRLITGIVVTPQSQLSIGRHQKRKIRSLFYQFSKNQLSAEDTSHLKGLVAFAFSIEPELRDRLRRKFGDQVIHELERAPSVPRKVQSSVIGFRRH